MRSYPLTMSRTKKRNLLSLFRFMMGPLAPFESKSASISEYEGSLALFNRLDMSTIVCCGDKIYVGWKESIKVYKKIVLYYSNYFMVSPTKCQ